MEKLNIFYNNIHNWRFNCVMVGFILACAAPYPNQCAHCEAALKPLGKTKIVDQLIDIAQK